MGTGTGTETVEGKGEVQAGGGVARGSRRTMAAVRGPRARAGPSAHCRRGSEVAGQSCRLAWPCSSSGPCTPQCLSGKNPDGFLSVMSPGIPFSGTAVEKAFSDCK